MVQFDSGELCQPGNEPLIHAAFGAPICADQRNTVSENQRFIFNIEANLWIRKCGRSLNQFTNLFLCWLISESTTNDFLNHLS